MRARSSAAAVLVTALSITGCTLNPAPRGWLPRAPQLAQTARGAWISVKEPEVVSGELIAVDSDWVYVLTVSGLRSIPAAGVRRAVLAIYDGRMGSQGALLSLTHGWFMPITATLWGVVESGEARAPLLRLPPKSPSELRPYARFPQGLPAELSHRALGPLLPGPGGPLR